MKELRIKTDMAGNLDKDDCRDRFKIMQNKDAFSYYLFNCLSYSFSEHVNGFFEVSVLCTLVKSASNIFSCNEEAEHRSMCIIMSLEKFDFIEIKVINGESGYMKSTISAEDFSYFCEMAKKFCNEFDQVLSGLLDIFKDWIVDSEQKKKEEIT